MRCVPIGTSISPLWLVPLATVRRHQGGRWEESYVGGALGLLGSGSFWVRQFNGLFQEFWREARRRRTICGREVTAPRVPA